MAEIPCFQVDAFAERPFTGNPAAVCLLETAQDEDWMQSVAAEMNLSETAFVAPGKGGFDLRWFTPAVEVDLCGHATLASAHVLWEQGIVAAGAPVLFETRSGVLECIQQGDRIELDFPATPPEPMDLAPELAIGLGAEVVWQGKSRFDAVVIVDSEKELRALRPDFAVLKDLPYRGIIVSSTSDNSDIDFVSRFFGPAVGIDEDPVTGSAHCCLAPFWAQRFGKEAMTAFQASKRGGTVHVRVAGKRVVLGGKAVTVFRGALTVAPGVT